GPHALAPGPGTLRRAAVPAARGSPGAGAAAAAATTATVWYAAHRTVRFLDDNGKHIQAVHLVTTPGPDHSGTLFTRLDDSLTRAISPDQAAFHANARARRNAFT